MRSILTFATAALLVTAIVVTAQVAPGLGAPPGMHPSDSEVAAWFKFRQMKWAETRAADPNQPTEIAAIKAHTMALIAAAGPTATSLDSSPLIWPTGTVAPLVIHDDPAAPRMVVIPAGEFTMGSPESEPGRAASEGPRRRVRIARAFAVSMFPIVYGEYALFAADTHRPASAPCVTPNAGKYVARADRTWRDLGYKQTVRHPVVCVSFPDAEAYAAWLSANTGHRYRLLSEAEYEYVNRAGTTSRYWWGHNADAACAYANGLDQDSWAAIPVAAPIGCRDGYVFTAPVGSFKPNAFGLFDTTGNASSWTAECGRSFVKGRPVEGSADHHGECGSRMVRGGSWATTDLRAASYHAQSTGYAGADLGFRVAREL